MSPMATRVRHVPEAIRLNELFGEPPPLRLARVEFHCDLAGDVDLLHDPVAVSGVHADLHRRIEVLVARRA
jgi:hypothetical protein